MIDLDELKRLLASFPSASLDERREMRLAGWCALPDLIAEIETLTGEVDLWRLSHNDCEARIERLEAALGFYAAMSDKDYAAALSERVDIGQRARAALESEK